MQIGVEPLLPHHSSEQMYSVILFHPVPILSVHMLDAATRGYLVPSWEGFYLS
jgi:hypothetical protein